MARQDPRTGRVDFLPSETGSLERPFHGGPISCEHGIMNEKNAYFRMLGGPPTRALGLVVLSAAALVPNPAEAATWVDTRTTPSLTELVTIDATGEQGWLYGAEDLAGDGIASFKQQEQSIDIRTAYATTDATRLWVRVYVSELNAVGGNVSIYAFIDSDRSTATGGTAAAPEIDTKFTEDTSPGGYDYVIGIRGNGSISGLWSWDATQTLFIGSSPAPAQAVAEVDQDIDPIQINSDAHGYAQAAVDLALVGLTPACLANFYIRSSNTTAGLGKGDLQVGQVAPCIPADTNSDGIPDIVIPSGPCTSDDQCPANGICVDGKCIVPVPCVADPDCPPDELCSPDRVCVATPGGMCTTTANCVDLVCAGGTCVPCTPSGTECGIGRRCGPSRRCVDDAAAGGGEVIAGIPISPFEDVQGGAFTCAFGARGGSEAPFGLLALGLGLGLARRIGRRTVRKGSV
jgi:hypothetical protein